MKPYIILVVSLALLPVTGGAIATDDTGETRVGVGYVFGTATLDDDFGNELSADVTSIGLNLDHLTVYPCTEEDFRELGSVLRTIPDLLAVAALEYVSRRLRSCSSFSR